MWGPYSQGAALTEDVHTKWSRQPGKGHHSCSTCTTEVHPTVDHMLWEIPGYQDLRAQYLQPCITHLQQWTTSNNNARSLTPLSLAVHKYDCADVCCECAAYICMCARVYTFSLFPPGPSFPYLGQRANLL